MNEGGDLLTLENITKSYRSRTRDFLAIKDVNLRIRTGEFVCLLGPSGCGKSTLLRIIMGLIPATRGNVLYRGQPLAGINPYATIVFQTFALYPWLTVLENVDVALKARGVSRPERKARALKLLDMVGLDGFESAFPRELSGGMRQKVGFARAMAVEPKLLCLDEPFSALDVLSAEGLRGELMELWLSKSIPTEAILMVTHSIEEAVLMADRVVVMGKEPGRVVAEIPLHLTYPRRRKDTAFQALVDKVYAVVAGKGADDTAALRLAARRLPTARLNAIAGLVEKLAEEGGQTDLYRLSDDLVLDLDDLLPVVEAAEVLGFVNVSEGDLILTPLGKTFAEASILARKEMISGRILRHPTIRWIYETLQADDDQRVSEQYFLEKLEADFGDLAAKQLETAINWARYAEVFAFDDATGELYLEAS